MDVKGVLFGVDRGGAGGRRERVRDAGWREREIIFIFKLKLGGAPSTRV
jgi:hypothetical protein